MKVSKFNVGQHVPHDAGLQAERTALAWNRTALTVSVNAFLALRAGWASQQMPVTVFAFALQLAAAVTFLYGVKRGREMLFGERPNPPRAGVIVATTGVALAACAVELGSIFVT